jgi:hypothetical protein
MCITAFSCGDFQRQSSVWRLFERPYQTVARTYRGASRKASLPGLPDATRQIGPAAAFGSRLPSSSPPSIASVEPREGGGENSAVKP